MVGEGVLTATTLARAEPLTTLPRSARSRVSWSLAERRLRGHPRLPVECRNCTRVEYLGARDSLTDTPSFAWRAPARWAGEARNQSMILRQSPWGVGGGPRRRHLFGDQETRDRAERGSVVRGSARAKFCRRRGPPPTDRQESQLCQPREHGFNLVNVVSPPSEECEQSPPQYEWLERVAKKKLAQLGDLEPLVLRRRLFAFLARRGYDVDEINAVVSRLT